ncbi:MAG: ATP-binding protein [Halobacteriota archaeon]
MPSDVVLLVGFTLLPLAVLLIGTGLAVAFSYAVRDSRILLAALLFGLMASHQAVELVLWLGGGDPHQTVLGEVFETTVNLLAVVAVSVIAGSLTEERLLADSLADVQRSLFEVRPGSVPGRSEHGDDLDGAGWNLRERIAERLGTGGTATVPLVFGHRSRVDEVLERAVENARVTFPIATIEVESETGIDVVAERTYLQEIFEILLEQLILYNDTSDPVIEATLERTNGDVTVELSHNGSGLPADVRTILESGSADQESGHAELVFVQTFVSQWGGSVQVDTDEEPTVTLTFAAPRFAGFFG